MLSEKAQAEKLDANIQKILQKVVANFLYYARSVDPKMLMVLNSLTVVQTNPTTETTKQATQLLNYSATNPDTVIEYRRGGMIIHIYSDASNILESKE